MEGVFLGEGDWPLPPTFISDRISTCSRALRGLLDSSDGLSPRCWRGVMWPSAAPEEDGMEEEDLFTRRSICSREDSRSSNSPARKGKGEVR